LIDTNVNYAEMILKHVLDKREGVAEANSLYEEIAERINAEGLKRAREVWEVVINGVLII
jgi:HEPN domain-containing protein